MIDTPELMAWVIANLLREQNHLLGFVTVDGAIVRCDADGATFEITVKRWPTPADRARAQSASNN